MSTINRLGLFLWFLVIVGLLIPVPIKNMTDFVCALAMIIIGAACFIWPGDDKSEASK